MEEMSPQKFRAFTDILFAEMGKSQVDVKSLIDGKMAVLKAQNEGLSESELRSLAYSEVVAEMMETAMTDTDVLTRISAKIKKTDSSLWGKIKNFLQGLVEKLKSAYRGLNPDSAIARLAKETIARSEAVLEAFSDAAADAVMNYQLQDGQKNTAREGERYSPRVGTAKDGRSMYEGNFPMGTPKSAKSSVILEYIQNVWSKKPIQLDVVGEDGTRRKIMAQFDPSYDPTGERKGDASKIAGGNRHGTSAEQRVTLDLGADYHSILSESSYNYSKEESGKATFAHNGVKTWHYYVDEIYFAEKGTKDFKPYTVSINVKEKDDGAFVYSFSAEKGEFSTPGTLHAPVDSPVSGAADAKLSMDMVTQGGVNVNREDARKSSRDSAGNVLTEAQQRYFADSQVRDEDGNLKVVYHGSPAIFTEFSADFMSSHGSSEGQGFYFTDYKPMAEGYQKSGGQLLEGYLNILKPLSDSEVTLKRAEVRKLLKALDPTGDDLVLNYDSGGGMGYPSRSWYNRALNDTLNAVMGNESDSEILGELANAMGNSGAVLEKVRSVLGYDGYIVSGKYDNANVYVAFDSSQFKNADNQNPTGARDIRYSSRTASDSEYLNLAQNPEENREALSRMVENAAREAGYTRLFFHGSKKGGGFTVFRDWQYFTENREYAKRYANRENPGSLYETYVKMENPFDTRIPEVRELFEQARLEYGMGELQENGLPDWTDGYDIADYIDENDLPYDGIILDEGGDMVNGKPVSRGLSYVIRDSSQVKSADAVTYDDNGNVIPLSQRFDTGKEDIRYSARNPQAQVEAENERLKSDVKRQIAEAVREYRRQQDVQSKVYRQMYERQLEEVKKSYQKQISSMESEYSANLAQIQDAFFQTVEAYEKGQFRNEHLEKVLKQAAETQRAQAKASEADNATWEKEFKRLLRAYETSGRDVQRLKQTVENQRARAKAKVEAARVTEQRGKLYRAVNEINRRLLNPTKTLYVPDSLAPAVTKFMQGLTEAMESPKNSWNVQGALETLQEQYRKLTQMNEGVFTQEYNQGILDLLDNAISAVGGTDFNKLSASQIEDVYSAVRSVLTAIRNENKMFAANLNKTYAEAAEAVRREEAALPNRKPTTGAVQDKAEKFGWNQLKPVYAMMRLGSDTLLKQYNNLRAGEDKWQRIIAAARAYGLGIMEKYHYDQWNDSLMKLDTETGTVELSLEERMSLYAYARREQAFEHLTKGGFVLSDKNTRTVKNRFGIKTEQT